MNMNHKCVGVKTWFLALFVLLVSVQCRNDTMVERFKRWSRIEVNNSFIFEEQGGLFTGEGRFWAVAFEYSETDLELMLLRAGYQRIDGFKDHQAWSEKITKGASIPTLITESWYVYRMSGDDWEKLFFLGNDRTMGLFVESSW